MSVDCVFKKYWSHNTLSRDCYRFQDAEAANVLHVDFQFSLIVWFVNLSLKDETKPYWCKNAHPALLYLFQEQSFETNDNNEAF